MNASDIVGVAGIDLFSALLQHCAKTGRKPFVRGATQANLDRAIAEGCRRYPGLVFAGARKG